MTTTNPTSKPRPVDKPNAQRNGWQIRQTTYPHSTHMLRLRQDELRLPNGQECTFTYVEKTPAVFIIPITTQGDIVLIRQFRYINDRWSWEVPAGGTHDFDGEDLSVLARRELREEIGGTAEHMEHLGIFYGASGVLSQKFYIYLARGVHLARQQAEPTEFIEVHPMPLDEALTIMRSDEADAFDAYVLMRYEALLRDIVRDMRRET